MNHHTPSAIRAGAVEAADATLGAILHEDLVCRRRVAQDRMQVRANADAAFLRRKRTLETCLRDAREPVRDMQAQLVSVGGQDPARVRAVHLRVDQDRPASVTRALSELRMSPDSSCRVRARRVGRPQHDFTIRVERGLTWAAFLRLTPTSRLSSTAKAVKTRRACGPHTCARTKIGLRASRGL